MSSATGGLPASRQLHHRGTPLHPLEVRPAPRRRYQLALALQLLSAAGTLALGTGLVLPAASAALPAAGALLAAGGWAGAHALPRRAWAGLPAPRRRAAMPASDDRRYAGAAALLLMLWAAGVSAIGRPAGFWQPSSGWTRPSPLPGAGGGWPVTPPSRRVVSRRC